MTHLRLPLQVLLEVFRQEMQLIMVFAVSTLEVALL